MKTKLILMMMLISLAGFRISTCRTITGTVSDAADKTGLVGVSVKVEGTSIEVATNVSGHYSINVPEGKDKLVFRYIGYVGQTVKIEKSNRINVLLRASTQSLNEVAITGYRAKQQRTAMGSVSTVSAKDLEELQPTSVGQALQGRIATDVVEYKASAYRVRENATTDKLLKSMPDVVVDANGNVTSQTVKIRGNAGNESYNQIIENPFVNPLNTPLSTFAVDVDAASYGNFRRYVNSGQLPPKNAVRIEEMINYFHYNLPQPTNGEPVAIHTELTAAPWNAQHRLLRIGLKAKNVETSKLPPSNLVFLLDVSGSMSDANKLPLVKASMKLLVDQLRAVDHVAIVVYAGDAGLKLPSTPGDQKTVIKDAIDALNAGGGTAGGAGLMLAYKVAREKFIKGGNNRIILATDGDFNVGASSDKDMEQLIAEERESGVSISILGFGMYNLKDSKMETMADKGHGNYAYIDNITEATKSMVNEFGGTLFTVAKDVKMQIEFNPAKVQAYRLLGYEDRLLNKEDFNNDKKLGGDMGVGHTVTALYEIIPAGVKDSFTDSVDPLKYQKVEQKQVLNNSAEMVTVKFRYKEPDSDKSKMELVAVKDEPVALAKTSDDMRFAASVAELGLLLRGSEFKQQANFADVIAMAKGAKGKDEEGYRAEFIRLAESAGLMYTGNLVVAGKK
ncbi:von Willebrand factor type A domain-containing protein [Mucilaginibacter sp. HMF5004]|uniref:YfbK domain-containing protein n=1 Tax=Mucilaginibacter rivuli TaxID=2857527 RepID=UPI001C5E2F34|nr:von Willebrand factor type A domain-containing protein [Mucilaginibacter rivuli]MBW4890684.1 von Willebrand factor type A domain-containing protein [Mucilaginibacter rivuli]